MMIAEQMNMKAYLLLGVGLTLAGCEALLNSDAQRPFYFNNGRPSQIENGCYVQVSQPYLEWQTSHPFTDLYMDEIVPEAYKYGRPPLPPIASDNNIYMYVSCSSNYAVPRGWTVTEIDEVVYSLHLAEFDGLPE